MAAEAYRAEGDVVGSWLQDNIEQGSSTSASLTDLYTDYSAWCEANGEFAIKRRSLLQELRNHGYAESRDDDGRQSIVGLQVRNNTLLEHLGY
jgi:phage/plasmid-associated DNA primase